MYHNVISFFVCLRDEDTKFRVSSCALQNENRILLKTCKIYNIEGHFWTGLLILCHGLHGTLGGNLIQSQTRVIEERVETRGPFFVTHKKI